MNRFGILVFIIILIAGFYFLSKTHDSDFNQLYLEIRSLQKNLKQLDDRLSKLETKSRSEEPVPPPIVKTPPKNFDTKKTDRENPSAVTPTSIVDEPRGPQGTCTLASIQIDAQLAETLTWDVARGGRFVGSLPAGSVVEILDSSLPIWNDYPNEHALLVRVNEAPRNPSMVGQMGYLELSKINHRRCNLGSEFER